MKINTKMIGNIDDNHDYDDDGYVKQSQRVLPL